LCRDPDDIYLVALTRYTDAHYLISRDRDLLDMDHPHLHVRSPEQILKMLTD
jgi:predicted nucleic acid-binding protein